MQMIGIYCTKILIVWIPPGRVKMDTWNIWNLQTHKMSMRNVRKTEHMWIVLAHMKKRTHIWSYQQRNRKHLDKHLNLTITYETSMWNVWNEHIILWLRVCMHVRMHARTHVTSESYNLKWTWRYTCIHTWNNWTLQFGHTHTHRKRESNH